MIEKYCQRKLQDGMPKSWLKKERLQEEMSKRLPDDGAGWCKEEAEPTIDELPPPTFKDQHLQLRS